MRWSLPAASTIGVDLIDDLFESFGSDCSVIVEISDLVLEAMLNFFYFLLKHGLLHKLDFFLELSFFRYLF